jgi:hypothetical protein
MDGHDRLALFDPVAEFGTENETASEADHIVLLTAARTGIDGRHADTERINGRYEAGSRSYEFHLV